MEKLVSGCIDCPLFDVTGSEYHTYCHHPQRPIFVTVSNMDDYSMEIEPTEKEKNDYISNHLFGTFEELEELRRESWKSRRYPSANEPEIEDDAADNPITPDWCPLYKEPITIRKTLITNGKGN